jgi:uncharacterized integral membrane protein
VTEVSTAKTDGAKTVTVWFQGTSKGLVGAGRLLGTRFVIVRLVVEGLRGHFADLLKAFFSEDMCFNTFELTMVLSFIKRLWVHSV